MQTLKKQPGAVTTVRGWGVFWKKISSLRGDLKKEEGKKRTRPHSQQRHSGIWWSCRNPAASTKRRRPAPKRNTGGHPSTWRSLRRPGAAAAVAGADAETRSRACCASHTARTTPSHLPVEVLDRWRSAGPKAAALLPDSDEAECDRVHPPPIPRRRRRGNSWSGGGLRQGLCSKRALLVHYFEQLFGN